MAVKIRLKRTGATKRPCYRLVVADARSPRDGRFIESVGFYDPLTHPATVRVDVARVEHWLRVGARPSDSARALLEREGVLPRTERRVVTPAGSAAPAAEPPGPEAAPEGAAPGGAAPAGAGSPPEAVETAGAPPPSAPDVDDDAGPGAVG